jgi:hypothetical protein
VRHSEPRIPPGIHAAQCARPHWRRTGYICNRLRSGRHFLFMKTFAAKHWPGLPGCERNRCLQSTFRAGCLCLMQRGANGFVESAIALRLAPFAMLRQVCEILCHEVELLRGGEHKVGSAIDTRQLNINENHYVLPTMKESGRRFSGSRKLASLYAAECGQSRKTTRHTAPHLQGSAGCFDSRNFVFPKWKNLCRESPKRVYAFINHRAPSPPKAANDSPSRS